MTGEFALLALTAAAWFIFFLTFLSFSKRNFFDWFHVKGLDRKVMLAMEGMNVPGFGGKSCKRCWQ